MFNKFRHVLKFLFFVSLASVWIIAVTYCFFFFDDSDDDSAKNNIVVTEKDTRTDEDHEDMKKMIQTILGEESDRYAVYIFRPKKDLTPITFQSRRMKPASMVKIFVMAKAMQDAKDGKLSLSESLKLTPENIVGGAGSIAWLEVGTEFSIRFLIECMIKESDNTATNMLIDRIGMDNINQYLSEQGYYDTEFQHKMMLANAGRSNYSSAMDIGKILTKIYNHECVDDYHDQVMIHYLLKQDDTDCLPAALPNWSIAHKTGETLDTYHDGGICYGKNRDFIIVLMNDNYVVRGETIDKMKKIAASAAIW